MGGYFRFCFKQENESAPQFLPSTRAQLAKPQHYHRLNQGYADALSSHAKFSAVVCDVCGGAVVELIAQLATRLSLRMWCGVRRVPILWKPT
jgi:hypothetical protein